MAENVYALRGIYASKKLNILKIDLFIKSSFIFFRNRAGPRDLGRITRATARASGPGTGMPGSGSRDCGGCSGPGQLCRESLRPDPDPRRLQRMELLLWKR